MYRRFSLIAVAAIAVGSYSSANATSLQTWVSGTGTDGQACTRAAPCATFAAAIAQTTATGTIGCLDSGDFGPFTISKAVSVKCDNVEARIGAPSTTPGITILAGVTDSIFISGLNIQGYGTGSTGIRITRAGLVGVTNSVIGGFGTAAGAGINFTPSSSAVPVTLKNVASAANSYGLYINSSSAGTSNITALRLENCDMSGNKTAGVRILATAAPTGVDISDTRVTQNGTGVYVDGAYGLARLRNTIISTNGTGIDAVAGATVTTAGTNEILDNTTPGSTPVSQGQQ